MKCETCTFYKKETSVNGECRKNAPVILDGITEARWAVVKRDDYCGQYAEDETELFKRAI